MKIKLDENLSRQLKGPYRSKVTTYRPLLKKGCWEKSTLKWERRPKAKIE